MHYQDRAGTGDQSLLRSEEHGITYLLSLPGVRDWWAQNPYGFSQEFRDYINGLHPTEPTED